ncbi:MAG: heavy-metal-associated domain-containing protein [Bacteroidota bacterium]
MKKLFLGFFVATFLLSLNLFAENIKDAKFSVNMTCETCKGKIEKTLKAEKGVVKYNTDLASKTVSVSYDADKTNEENIKKSIAKLGYTVGNVPEIKSTKTDVKPSNSGCSKNCTGSKDKKCND